MEELFFAIITGLSGAGKTEALRCFEDLGYFCIDNLPPSLIPKLAELCAQSEGRIQRVALVIDVRGGEFFESLFGALDSLKEAGFRYGILFLEASEDVLVRRYKESRRRHPLALAGTIVENIKEERRRLAQLRERAAKIIDTSALTNYELKKEIVTAFSPRPETPHLNVNIISFGFKHGVPIDADLLFDVRFLPNPYYIDSLRPHTGNEEIIKNYIFKWPVSQHFRDKLLDFMDFLLPLFAKEGRSQLIVGIGCTGGRHRSVAIANVLGDFLRARGYQVQVEHRDLATSSGVA